MSFRWMISGTPRPVQVEALNRSYGKKGFAFFMQMRLGKSATVLNEFVQYMHDYDQRYMLILTPNKFKPDWIEIPSQWGVNLPVHDFVSSKYKDLLTFIKNNPSGIVCVNYEALVQEKNVDVLMKLSGPDTFIVADESIKLKNPSSATYKAALRLAKGCQFRRALSGKPTTQGQQDLFGQIKFIGELDGWNYALFKAAFCVLGGFQGKVIVGSKNDDRLKSLVEPCSFSARKIDWIEGFQSPDYVTVKVDLEGEQARLYKSMQDDFVAKIGDKTVSASQVITRLIKQSQIASGFVIDEFGTVNEIVSIDKNPRVNAVLQLMEEQIVGKLIVFAHFKHSINMLLKALSDYNPAVIRGGAEDVVAEKRKFNEDESCRVIVCQIDASKYGHTLVGSELSPCLNSVYFENTYSLDARSQTEERMQFGDKAISLTVIDLYSTKLDKIILSALQRKEDVSAKLLGYDRATGILPK